jgi:hypothetical protein
MSNIILGLVMATANVLTGVYMGVSWWTVAGVSAGIGLVGFGLHERLKEKGIL